MPLYKACVVRGTDVCANPVHAGQRSDWWETTEQKRVRVQVPPPPHTHTFPSLPGRSLQPSTQVPSPLLGSCQAVFSILLSFPLKFWVSQQLLRPLPLQVQDCKNFSLLPTQTTALSLVQFPKPCPHLCKYPI